MGRLYRAVNAKSTMFGKMEPMTEPTFVWPAPNDGSRTAKLYIDGQKVGQITVAPFRHQGLTFHAETVLNVWVSPRSRHKGIAVSLYRTTGFTLGDEGKVLLSSYSLNDGATAVWDALQRDYPDNVGTVELGEDNHRFFDGSI